MLLKGLVARPDLNGEIGLALKFASDSGRWLVCCVCVFVRVGRWVGGWVMVLDGCLELFVFGGKK